MTKQEIFNKVWNHIHAQKRAATKLSEFSQTECFYRLKDGDSTLMCAAGCLIPDEIYDKRIENISIIALADRARRVKDGHIEKVPVRVAKRVIEALGGVENLPLIARLQLAHDRILSCNTIGAWRKEMRQIAKREGIKVPPIPKAA